MTTIDINTTAIAKKKTTDTSLMSTLASSDFAKLVKPTKNQTLDMLKEARLTMLAELIKATTSPEEKLEATIKAACKFLPAALRKTVTKLSFRGHAKVWRLDGEWEWVHLRDSRSSDSYQKLMAGTQVELTCVGSLHLENGLCVNFDFETPKSAELAEALREDLGGYESSDVGKHEAAVREYNLLKHGNKTEVRQYLASRLLAETETGEKFAQAIEELAAKLPLDIEA